MGQENLQGGPPMNIKYADSVKQWDEGYPLVQRATNRLPTQEFPALDTSRLPIAAEDLVYAR
jgi:hypothetical protein